MTEFDPDHRPTRPSLDPQEPALLGLDNVPLDLQPAGLGTRSLAMMVDSLAILLLGITWGLAMWSLAALTDWSGAWAWAAGAFGFFLLQWGYFSVCEVLMEGQTPGKRLVSIRTVSHLGGQPSVAAVVIRNLLRSIDYLFGVFVMVFDPRSRRLGDLVASTLVVHQAVDSPGDAFRMERVPEQWTTEEVLLVESFLRRAARMDREVARDLSKQLLGWIERTAPGFYAEAGPLPELDEEQAGAVPPELHRLCALLSVQTQDAEAAA